MSPIVRFGERALAGFEITIAQARLSRDEALFDAVNPDLFDPTRQLKGIT